MLKTMVSIMASLLIFLSSSCQTYQYAHQVKMISFHDNFTEGESVGNVSAMDCQSAILGFPTGPDPTLDRAMESSQTAGKNKDIRYINDVSTANEGFDAGVYAKRCILVKGRGYK